MNGTGIPFGAPSFLDALAHTDAGGNSSFSFPVGFPTTLNLPGMQCLVNDPTSPAAATLTAATDLSVSPTNSRTTNFILDDDDFVTHPLLIPISF